MNWIFSCLHLLTCKGVRTFVLAHFGCYSCDFGNVRHFVFDHAVTSRSLNWRLSVTDLQLLLYTNKVLYTKDCFLCYSVSRD